MKNIGAVALLCFAITGRAAANPSPEIAYLTREPASMLDVGLDRLRDSILTVLGNNLDGVGVKSLPSVDTTYDYARDQIQIIVSATTARAAPSPKEICRRLVSIVKLWMNSTTVWTDGFTHAGYTENGQEDAAVKSKLPSLIVINGAVLPDKPPTLITPVGFCSVTLSTPVSYTGP